MNWVLSKSAAGFIWDSMREDCQGEAACIGNSEEWRALHRTLDPDAAQ